MTASTGSERVRAMIEAELPRWRSLRHDFHAHPELAYAEHRTARRVCEELASMGIEFKAGLAGGTGVVAHLPATAPPAPGADARAVALRADMDALPITETTGVPYASRTAGLMHACGHDGHTTILLAAASVLRQLPRPRPVTLVFQPAEEGGGGGERLCEEGVLDGRVIGPPVARIFGLHGWPELEEGHVWTRPGPMLAATDELRITVRGVEGHGAYPHLGRDPIVASAQVVLALQAVVSRGVDPLQSAVVTVGTIHAGTATNIIPAQVEMSGTIRSLSEATRQTVHARVREAATHAAAAHGCEATVTIEPGYPVTRNDEALTAHWFDVARAVLGPARVAAMPAPTMGGEDFAYYARLVPAVFFCLGLRGPGQDRCPSLHQSDFDFNDRAIPAGVELFCALATAP